MKYTFIFLACYGAVFTCHSQISPQQLKTFIETSNAPRDVAYFYEQLGYKTAWIQKENHVSLQSLSNLILTSKNFGLNETDYSIAYIDSVKNYFALIKNSNDSLEAEIKITNAAINLCSDLHYGNTNPFLGYKGVENYLTYINTVTLLADCVAKENIKAIAYEQSDDMLEVSVIYDRLRWINRVMSESDFDEIQITSDKVAISNIPLVTKLYQLGVDTSKQVISDSVLHQLVQEVQRLFNLPINEPQISPALVKALNVPLDVRRDELSLSVNYYKWLRRLSQQYTTIVVNIPAAYLKVYQKDSVIMEMRMVVGKPSTPTPTLSSWINAVTFFPYWYVPRKIAVNELLPIFKKRPAYIEAGNFQLLHQNGEIAILSSINWNQLNRHYFPYTIRQGTGCDNSLGILKLNFDNPFSVYLHDTPQKSLFLRDSRYFSHGCMRMEKPMDLVHLILKDSNESIDSLLKKGCLLNQPPINISVDEQLPLIVWYNPAGIDSTGAVVFFEDIYQKFSAAKAKN